MSVRSMQTRIPHSILVHDLLAIEINILFLKLTIALNVNINAIEIMDQNGIVEWSFPYNGQNETCNSIVPLCFVKN